MWINATTQCENITGYYYPDVVYYNPWLIYVIFFGIVILFTWAIKYAFGVMRK